MKKVIDTNVLLQYPEIVFSEDCIIPSVVISELEHIKTSGTKSEETRFQARKATRMLVDNQDKYSIFIVNKDTYEIVENHNLLINNDNLIIACCKQINSNEIVFCSNDLLARLIAKNIFEIQVVDYKPNKLDEYYKGYKEVVLDNEKMAYFYEHLNDNQFECLQNEYLIIKDTDEEIIDTLKWNGKGYVAVFNRGFKSRMFGNIKPLDDIQRCAFDSIASNEITIMYGKAGSGKTTIPLAYIMQMLETQKIKTCHIVYHYEPLKYAKTLGFEKGSHTEKILNSGSLGNILGAKFGDIQVIQSMISSGILNIVPTANIRGVEFGTEDMVFCTESQNLDVYTLKTIIQRCKEGCKQVYEGDIIEQSDINRGQLGIERMIDVFKGYEKFGCVKLKNNYRNSICELADQM